MKYLCDKDIVTMNVIQIKKYSPNEHIGVKDPNALEMCVGQLKATAFGEEVYPSVYEKAALLLIQLIKKHPFHNANKRTADKDFDQLKYEVTNTIKTHTKPI